MPKLVLLRGLPGSGKSTYAQELLAKHGNMIRVNRDELRECLHKGLKWTGARESATISAEMAIAADALSRKYSVVVDDTNLTENGVAAWKRLAVQCDCVHELDSILDADTPETATKRIRVYFEIKDFTDVPIDECVKRDALRSGKARVGRGVIERMALKACLIDLSKLDKVAIVDVDGTLACLDHRLHFIQREPKDYDSFFGKVSSDMYFHSIVSAVVNLCLRGYKVIIVSGRPASTGYDTNKWLMSAGIPFEHLFMRNSGDHKPDHEAKEEILQMMFKAGLRKDAIKVVIDDRDSVCDGVWRKHGLPLIQVDRGNAIQIHPDALKTCIEIGIPVSCG